MFPTFAECATRIRERDPLIRAYISTRLADADHEHTVLSAEPPRSQLHGVAYSLKDEWETVCLPTTGGSWRHRDRRSTEDAPIVHALREAGAILVGKTNMSDLGIPPESSTFLVGSVRNPSNLERTAGGSSGGSAAAVADGMVGFDWGADIGGSIRYPAGLCGIYGMRLASESWPVTHLFPVPPESMRWLCAQGPLTRTLEQMRAVLQTVAPALRKDTGRPAFRATGVALHGPPGKTLWGDFAGEAGPLLAQAIGPLREHDLPSTRRMQWIYSSIWCSHLDDLMKADPTLSLGNGVVASLLSVLGVPFEKRVHSTTGAMLLQIVLGRALIFRDKGAARANAMRVKDGFERLWGQGVVVAMPVTCYPAPEIGKSMRNPRLLECTMPGNLADATGLAVPFGRFADGMPRALQLLGPPGSELQLIELAERFVAQRPSA